MSLSRDISFFHRIQSRLKRVTRLKETTWKFRCPVCGDSKKDKKKTRGYLYPNKKRSGLAFKCHNCGCSSWKQFLESVDPSIYREYRLNLDPQEALGLDTYVPLKPESIQIPKTSVQKFDKLKPDHHAVKYLIERKIPRDQWQFLRYTDDFIPFACAVRPELTERFKHFKDRKSAIVIPLIQKHNGANRFVGCQGRFFESNPKFRYMTVIRNDIDVPNRFFGTERINNDSQVYVVEGPFDSLFLPNCIAVCGSDMESLAGNDHVFIFDCEPRNPQIYRKMKTLLEKNERVVILPHEYSGKDLNDIVKDGLSLTQLKDLIDSNVQNGITGMVRLEEWKK